MNENDTIKTVLIVVAFGVVAVLVLLTQLAIRP